MQEYWSRLPFPPPGDLPDPGIAFSLLPHRHLDCHQGHQTKGLYAHLLPGPHTLSLQHLLKSQEGEFTGNYMFNKGDPKTASPSPLSSC